MTTDNDDSSDGFTQPDPAGGDDLDTYFDGGGDDQTSDDTTPDSDRRDVAAGVTDGGSSGDSGEEDDPWANVASEDELKRRATQDADPSGDDADADEEAEDGGDEDGDELSFAEQLVDVMQSAGTSPQDVADTTVFDRQEVNEILNADRHIPEPEQKALVEAAATGGGGPDPVGDDATSDNEDDDATTEDGHEQGSERAPPSSASELDLPETDSPPDLSHVTPDPDTGVVDASDLDAELVPESVSCTNCVHRDVCVILSSFAPRLADENWDAGTEDSESPVDPMDFAKICDAYTPEDDGDESPKATHPNDGGGNGGDR